MSFVRLTSVVVAVGLLGSAAFSQSATGSWHGHLEMTAPTPPATPAQRQQNDMVMAQMRKMVFLLKVNPDKTYSLVQNSGQSVTKPKTMTGTWSMIGKSVSFNISKAVGAVAPKSLSGALSSDGNTLTVTAEGGVKVVFLRG